MISAALRVPDDHGARAGVLQHLGRDITREGTGRLGVAILRPDRHRRMARASRKACNERRWRADQDVHAGCQRPCPLDDAGKLGR